MQVEPYFIKHNKHKQTSDSVCIFVSYSYGDVLQEYVYYYLNEIKKAGFDIIFVSSSALKEDAVKKLKEYSSFIIEKSNKGLDFASWLTGLAQINFGENYKNILLANDSVFGPFYGLKEIIDFANNSEYDMFGMTDSYEIDYHIQSYFLYFKSNIIHSEPWLKFWKNFIVLDNKKQIIIDYEIGLSQYMLKNKFRLGVLCSYIGLQKSNLISNSTIAFYQELITNHKFPFLKREILIREGISKAYAHIGMIIDIYQWKNILLNHTQYPIKLIEDYIAFYFNFLMATEPQYVINKMKNKHKAIFITHNASLSGAPIVFLNFIKWFKHNIKWDFEIIVRETINNGDFLLKEFQELAPTLVFSDLSPDQLDDLRFRLLKENIGIIFSNTLVNSNIEQFLSILNCPQICYVHELEYVITHLPAITDNIKWQIKKNNYFIACSEVVKNNLISNHGISKDQVHVVEEFISPPNNTTVSETELNIIKNNFGIPKNSFIIGGVGTIEWRKGSDLFISLAQIVCKQIPNAYFVWLGADKKVHADTYSKLIFDVEKSDLKGRVCFAPQDAESDKYYALFDLVAMVSREDPYPLVNLHAASFAKPIICFEKAGGSSEFIGKECGFVVPYLDINEMAKKIIELQKNASLRATLGKNGQKKLFVNNTTDVQAPKIMKIIESCIVTASNKLSNRPKINVLTHIYYNHSYEILKQYLLNLKDFDTRYLFSISLDSVNRRETIQKIKNDFPEGFILETPNIGKDIGGKFALLSLAHKLNLTSDYLVFVHDKMSPQTMVGDAWRNNLLKILLPEHIPNILSMLGNDKSIGIVGAKEHFFSEYDTETDTFRYNSDLIKEYLKKYNIKISNYNYISGTMYWIRNSIFESFFKQLDLINIRAELEEGNVLDNFKGTHAHTWERMFCWMATNQGYSITGI
jgi:lipopolysaccharide biosynthesis protein